MASNIEIKTRDEADKAIFKWLAVHDAADPIDGISRCREVLRGRIAAYAVALAAIEQDSEAVRRFVNEILPPPRRTKPRLAFVRGEDKPAA